MPCTMARLREWKGYCEMIFYDHPIVYLIHLCKQYRHNPSQPREYTTPFGRFGVYILFGFVFSALRELCLPKSSAEASLLTAWFFNSQNGFARKT